jgi:putative spermidine/putrescine transport system permease protein
MGSSAKRVSDRCAVVVFGAVVLAALAYLLLPVLVAMAMSFDAREYLGRFPPSQFSLQWYREFFSDPYYMNALRNSVVLAVVTALAATAIGVAAAVLLDRFRFPGHAALSVFFLSPLVVPNVILGFSLLIFFSMIGLFDGFARLMGGHLVITLPYTIRTTLASLVGIRKSLGEAALSLGATEWQAFWSVTFPLAKTGIVAGAIFAFAISIEDLSLSLFLVDPFSITLPAALLTSMRVRFNLTIAAASGVMILLTVGLVFLLDRLVGLDRVIGTGVYRT